MSYWSFTSLVHFWPPLIFNSGYAYGKKETNRLGVSAFDSAPLFVFHSAV